jgi:hypothetical protein
MIVHAYELNGLVGALLPFAQFMLQKHGAFLPLGAIVRSGASVIVPAGLDRPQTSAEEMLEHVRAALRDQASDADCTAVACCTDIKLSNLRSGEVSDAVHLFFEHRSGEALDVVFPYKKTGERVEFARPMVRLAVGGLFTPLPDSVVN